MKTVFISCLILVSHTFCAQTDTTVKAPEKKKRESYPIDSVPCSVENVIYYYYKSPDSKDALQMNAHIKKMREKYKDKVTFVQIPTPKDLSKKRHLYCFPEPGKMKMISEYDPQKLMVFIYAKNKEEVNMCRHGFLEEKPFEEKIVVLLNYKPLQRPKQEKSPGK